MDPNERHRFDVEIQRIPAGVMATSYHSHPRSGSFTTSSLAVERYVTMAGSRPSNPVTHSFFKPGQPHQLIAGPAGLVTDVVADNPVGDQGSRVAPVSSRWGHDLLEVLDAPRIKDYFERVPARCDAQPEERELFEEFDPYARSKRELAAFALSARRPARVISSNAKRAGRDGRTPKSN